MYMYMYYWVVIYIHVTLTTVQYMYMYNVCILHHCTCMGCQDSSNYEILSVFLMSSYGAPLAQRASYLAHSSLFGPDGTVNYDYIVTTCLFPMVYTLTIVEPKLIKTSVYREKNIPIFAL